MSPRVAPRLTRPTAARTRSSLAEYRSVQDQLLERMPIDEALHSVATSAVGDRSFWRYVTSTRSVTGDPLDVLDTIERRVLSKATNAAGGYLVPSDFDDQIVSLRRAGSRIGTVAGNSSPRTGDSYRWQP